MLHYTFLVYLGGYAYISGYKLMHYDNELRAANLLKALSFGVPSSK